VPKRVLIIEDDVHSRTVYAVMLRFSGFDVFEAMTGEAGIDVAAERTPDLILLDINLPGMDGWEVCQRLKSMAATAAIKIVILTAHAYLEDRGLAERCGAELLLTKPVEPTLVRKYVVDLIGAA
jgi:DNA-binding response OmpR family regulator